MCPLLARLGSSGCLGVLRVLFCVAAWAAPCLGESSAGWLDTYRVAPACPAASTFRAMVLQRVASHPEGLERLRVEVTISREPGGTSWLGRVMARDAGGAEFSREMADTSCDALAQALSLVVALGVDDAPGSDDAPLRAIASRAPAPSDGWGPVPPELAEPEPEPGLGASDRRRRTGLDVAPLVRAAVQSGLAPNLALGLGAGVALEWREQGLWHPRVELTAMAFDAPATTLAPIAAEMEMSALVAGARLCPLELAGAPWSLRPCFDLDAGRLTARGSGAVVTRGEVRHAPWLSGGVSLQAGVSPWHGPVQLSASLGAAAALARHEFFFAPDIAAFEVPAGSWRAAAGLAVMF
jgi:hypothetical protein